MWVVYALLLGLPCLGFAETTERDFQMCYQMIEQHFLDSDDLKEAMSLHPEINQGQWIPVVNEMRVRARDVSGIVKKRAQGLHPNPFRHPIQSDKAMNLLMQVLYETFHSVMVDNQILNEYIILEMFNFLKHKQYVRNNKCFPEEAKQQPPPQQQGGRG